MKNKNIYFIIGLIVAIIIFISFLGAKQDRNFNKKTGNQNNRFSENSKQADVNIASSDQDLKKYLDLALLDEYHARDTYKAIIEKFGEVKPFSNIINAEKTHISELEALYKAHNLTLPEYKTGNMTIADNIKDNCDIGVTAEIANAKLYKDTLLPSVQNYPDVVNVFTNLMNASQNNHLKAFERCK